jgi:hypothetical protein
MYAVGVTEIDNMLMKLSVSSKMTEQERDTVIPFILKVCVSQGDRALHDSSLAWLEAA